MRWIKSWYKKEIIKHNFRLAGWISVGYLIALLLSMVLSQYNLLTNVQQYPNHYEYYDHSLISISFVPMLLLFFVPTLTALVLFRYLHKQDASDFMHSLPSSRKTLFLSHTIFGALSLIIPQLITYLSLVVLDQSMDHQHLLELSEINHWFSISTAISLFIYALSVLVAMLTGVSLIQLIFTYIFLILPFGLTFLVTFNLHYAMPGLSSDYLMEEILVYLSPIDQVDRLITGYDINWMNIIIYYLMALVMFIVSYFLYKRRPTEAATQAIAFDSLKPIFIYSFTACFTLLGGLYAGLFQYDLTMLLLMYFIFSIIGYYISQMIVEKSWRVFTNIRPYIIFFIVSVIIIIGVSLDITGYVNRMPDIDEIEEAYVIDDYYNFKNRADYYGKQPGFTDPDDLEMIKDLHEDLITNAKRNDFLNYYRTIHIVYRLKNGSDIVREYKLDNNEFEVYENYHINNHPMYKRYSDPLFYLDRTRANKIVIETEYMDYKQLVITDQRQMVELIDNLRQDMLALPKEENIIDMMNYVLIHVPGEQEVYVNLTQEYTLTKAWLEKEGLLEKALVTAEDIEKVVVYPYEEDLSYSTYDYEKAFPEEERIIYTSKEAIERVLEQNKLVVSDKPAYMLMIYFNGISEPAIKPMDASFDLPN